MTDNTMREGKLWAFLHDSIHEAYKKLSTTGTSCEYHALLDSIAAKVADDVDDVALCPLPEMRQHGTAHVERRTHRAVKLRLVITPVTVIKQGAVPGVKSVGPEGVVHHGVDVAGLAHDLLDHRLHRRP